MLLAMTMASFRSISNFSSTVSFGAVMAAVPSEASLTMIASSFDSELPPLHGHWQMGRPLIRLLMGKEKSQVVA